MKNKKEIVEYDIHLTLDAGTYRTLMAGIVSGNTNLTGAVGLFLSGAKPIYKDVVKEDKKVEKEEKK